MLGVPVQTFAYPLDSNESLLSQRTLSDGTLELFTKKDNEFYKKSLRQDTGTWKVDRVEKLILPKTGLRTSKQGQQKDSGLAKSIETKLGASGYNLGALPRAVDYSTSNYLPPIGQQYENSCVAWSTGYYLRTYQDGKDLGWDVKQGGLPVNSHIFSPSFIYNQINGGVDDGSSMEDAGYLLKSEGAATLTDFPYAQGDYITQPSNAVIQAAYPHRIRDWGILYTNQDTQDYMIQRTKQYLLTGDLPVIGVNAGFNYMYPVTYNGKSFVTLDNSNVGGHAIAVVGYDDNIDTPDGKGAFKIANSWGTEWGDAGFGYVTYPEFAKSMMVCYVFTDLLNGPVVVVEQLPVKIQSNVTFNISFKGSGSYNLVIKDGGGNPVYRADGLKITGEVTSVKWLGNDSNGGPAPDGQYQLNITTGQNGNEQSIYDGTFQKQARVTNATAEINRLKGVIQSVTVHLTPSVNGKVDINVKNGSVTTAILTMQTIKAAQPVDYTISKELFDFNSVDLSKVTIELKAQ